MEVLAILHATNYALFMNMQLFACMFGYASICNLNILVLVIYFRINILYVDVKNDDARKEVVSTRALT